MKAKNTVAVWTLVVLTPLATSMLCVGAAPRVTHPAQPSTDSGPVASAFNPAAGTAAASAEPSNRPIDRYSGCRDNERYLSTATPPGCVSVPPAVPTGAMLHGPAATSEPSPLDPPEIESADPPIESSNPNTQESSFFKRHLAPNRLPPVALSVSLRLDSALAASVGLQLVFKLWGSCEDTCGGHFLFVDGEEGMFGLQTRLGFTAGYVAPVFVRYLLMNGVGFSVAGAYLQRTSTFDGKLADPREYMGLTLAGTALASLRVGFYQRLDGKGGLVTGSIGLGF